MVTNPNINWLSLRGTWVTNVFLVFVLKAAFSFLPGITPELSWSLTNLTYDIVTFFFFHWLLGSSFDLTQGEDAGLTLWEQLEDNAIEFHSTMKFLTVFPVILFLLSCHYTKYDFVTFCINFVAACVVLVSKFPAMYRVRLFGINKKGSLHNGNTPKLNSHSFSSQTQNKRDY